MSTMQNTLEVVASTLRPVKQRIAVVLVNEEATGIILIPSNANQLHRLGVLVAKGQEVKIAANVGDIVLFQTNRMLEAAITHYVDETAVMIMHQGDAIAKIDGRQITLEKFQVLGDWILATDIKLEMLGGLYLPDSAIPPPEFEIVQLGNTIADTDDPVIAEMKIGDKIYLDRSRANRISVELKQYFYVLKHGVHAVRVES